MSQIYPSPTLYTYRIRAFGINPSSSSPVTVSGITYGLPTPTPVIYIPEYSANGGTTWNPATNTYFSSAQDAYQAIANIVNNESSFATNRVAVPSTLAAYSTLVYPI